MGLGEWLFGNTKQKSNEEMLGNLMQAMRDLNIGASTQPEEPVEAPKSSIYRPETFDDYIGQARAKSTLRAYIKAIKERGNVLPHILIHGTAGCGKTTLVRIIAKEFGCDIKELIANDLSFYEIRDHISKTDGGMLFFDEVHRLDKNLVEPMYTIMEDFVDGNTKINPFCLVGTTTDLDDILKDRKPFYDRFKIIIELEDYTVEDLTKIVTKYKENSFFGESIDESSYEIIARNSRGTPRTAIRYLDATIYLGGNVQAMLDNNRIIKDGYTHRDLKALEYVAQNEKGVGLQGLASYLNISERLYMYEVEGYLLRNGLISRTPRGRKITDSGVKKIEELKNEKI